jgi:hypothetical protein
MGVFVIYNVSSVWVAMIVSIISYMAVGMGFTASNHLTLMQVPRYRGTIMSLF